MNCYKVISQVSGADLPDLQGTLKNGAISGQTISLGETSGAFIISSKGNATLTKTGTSSASVQTAQTGKPAVDVFSENGLYNGSVWKQGDRIYYSDSQGIYSSSLDGKEEKRLCADDPTNMVLSGEWIYFTASQCVYKIKTDGSFRQKISSVFSRDLYVDGDWIYYTGTARTAAPDVFKPGEARRLTEVWQRFGTSPDKVHLFAVNVRQGTRYTVVGDSSFGVAGAALSPDGLLGEPVELLGGHTRPDGFSNKTESPGAYAPGLSHGLDLCCGLANDHAAVFSRALFTSAHTTSTGRSPSTSTSTPLPP
jgi:hypothetical protein